MLRLYLMATGKLAFEASLVVVALVIVGLDAIFREFILVREQGIITSVISVLIYVSVIYAFMKLSREPDPKIVAEANVDYFVLAYIGFYCSVILIMAVFIPGSAFMDTICDSRESSCSLKRVAIEFLLRVLGVTAVLDFFDIKRLKDYRAK